MADCGDVSMREDLAGAPVRTKAQNRATVQQLKLMETRAQSALRLVPWESWQIWNEVRKAIFSSTPKHVTAALNKISAWRARNSLPVAVEVTWDLISIQRTDPYFLGRCCVERSFSDELLRQMYAMAIMRLINGIVDHSKKQSSLSVADRAEAAGLPRMLVDIRHEVAHQELPSLSYLRLASKQALDWLKVHYWSAQKGILDNAHNYLQGKLHAYASRYDVSENKEMLNAGCKRSIVLRAKKLVELNGPAINPLDECNSERFITHQFKEGETDHEKQKGLFVSDDIVDAEFQKSQFALSRARQRLVSLCRGHHLTEGTLETELEQMDSALRTTSCDFVDENHEKVERGPMKGQSSSMEAWSVADNWSPCAIGLLPSKFHGAGVLPFSGNLFAGVAGEVTTRVASIALNETSSQAMSQKAKETLEALKMRPKNSNDNQIQKTRDCFEIEGSGIDIVTKRMKMDSEAKQVIGNEEDNLCHLHHSTPAINKDVKIEPHGIPLSDKHKGGLSLEGLLLVEGVYQRCGLDSLAAIRSSIQILR